MLGILLIYFIWKYYSELAIEYNKNKWAYSLLGIASYYCGTFVVGLIIGVINVATGSDLLGDIDSIVINLIALPFGLLSVWGVYRILKNSWAKHGRNGDNDSLDSEFIQTNNN